MPLAIGLVGLGRWGMNIKRTLEELGARVIVVAEGEPIPESLDGVCIATPSSTHEAVALPYIERGIPTFIEKPVATSSDSVRRIEEAAMRTNAPVFAGHIYLYNPAFRTVVELCRSLGAIQGIRAEGTNAAPRPDSSVLWDWLPHHLAMAREVLQMNPTKVSVTSQEPRMARDAVVVTYLFGIIPLECRISWIAEERVRTFTIVATGGTIIFDEMADRKITLVKGGAVEHPSYDAEAPLAAELKAFLTMARTRAAVRPHLRDASDIVRAIEAAEAATGTSLPIA